MLPRRELNVGKSYVNENERIAREVIELSRMSVSYATYDLNTGKLCGASRRCMKRTLIQWADREATREEMANLQHHEADALYKTDDSIQRNETDLSLEQIQVVANSEMINHY
jgi:hypothetical protein